MSDMTAKARALIESLTGYTPGPWWTDGQYSGHQMGCSIIAANPDTGPPPGNPTRGQVAFATAVLNTDARRCEANARLIAAAPELRAELASLADHADALTAERDALTQRVERYEATLRAIGEQNVPPMEPFQRGSRCVHGRGFDEDCCFCTAAFARAALQSEGA